MKTEKTKALLRARELTVREISEKLGFDTPNYFSKVFKKHTGLTPSLYQKGSI
ncbi:MAG: helix-turn-helix domain-containing protein [Christensenellales bacterium]